MEKIIINESDYKDHFWKHNFLIQLDNAGEYIVNADHVQDALDYLIDYIEKNYPGLIMSREEEEEKEFLEEYIQGGNHGAHLNLGWHEIYVEEI